MPGFSYSYGNPAARAELERARLRDVRRAERRMAEFAAARKAKGWPV